MNYDALVYTALQWRLIKTTVNVMFSLICINKGTIIIENYCDDLIEKTKSTTRTKQLNKLKNTLIIYMIMRSCYGKVQNAGNLALQEL